jgi:hypothetical protein
MKSQRLREISVIKEGDSCGETWLHRRYLLIIINWGNLVIFVHILFCVSRNSIPYLQVTWSPLEGREEIREWPSHLFCLALWVGGGLGKKEEGFKKILFLMPFKFSLVQTIQQTKAPYFEVLCSEPQLKWFSWSRFSWLFSF